MPFFSQLQIGKEGILKKIFNIFIYIQSERRIDRRKCTTLAECQVVLKSKKKAAFLKKKKGCFVSLENRKKNSKIDIQVIRKKMEMTSNFQTVILHFSISLSLKNINLYTCKS